MPELPEVESARAVLERHALRRRIVDVDDADTWVCRPHAPGDIRAALTGLTLTSANRRGKSLWCDTSGPTLGIHLGMSGRIVFASSDEGEVDGGDYWERGRAQGDHRFTRFALGFADGTRLLLIDPRRLGRVRLDPPVERLGPDALDITPAQFRAALSRGTAPVKARLLDQEALAGVGNLLADETLWLAKVHPARPVDELTKAEVGRLHRGLRTALSTALSGGGVHTLRVVSARRSSGVCPRCGAPMHRGTVGGRTTWWCSREQAA
ncbi:Fpg/Nei family DNA glycosylase [Dactylosporangium salmoneum]|uniref:Formamidopyrimidine-DNA glycosylase n=1 Tax=Dactylosporangium salmoneum TaxID=53361 RepID=A0ABN3GIH8_9ACTN